MHADVYVKSENNYGETARNRNSADCSVGVFVWTGACVLTQQPQVVPTDTNSCALNRGTSHHKNARCTARTNQLPPRARSHAKRAPKRAAEAPFGSDARASLSHTQSTAPRTRRGKDST